MMKRCFDPSHHNYPNYGARGITVAPELRTVHGFIEVLGLRPAGKTLDRIDNNGNYEPGNVRWANIIEQQNNKRVNRLITWRGKTQSLAAWGRELQINPITLYSRLNLCNMSIDRAFTRKVSLATNTGGIRNRKLTDKQIIKIATSAAPQSVLAERYGVCASHISRIQLGEVWGHITGIPQNAVNRRRRRIDGKLQGPANPK